jgi:hypothetical protein
MSVMKRPKACDWQIPVTNFAPSPRGPCGDWNPESDAKLNALFALLTKQHANDKVLVFTQFADTVRYLDTQLQARGLR